MDRIVFPRSANKIFQCLALSSLNPRITEKEYSVICSSHNGQEEHVQIVSKFLKKNNLLADHLVCGPHWSLEKNTFINQVRKSLGNDYDVDNVSEKVIRIILSHIDFIHRNVWKKYGD